MSDPTLNDVLTAVETLAKKVDAISAEVATVRDAIGGEIATVRAEAGAHRAETATLAKKVDAIGADVSTVRAEAGAHRAETAAHRAETAKGFCDLDKELSDHMTISHRKIDAEIAALKVRPARRAVKR